MGRTKGSVQKKTKDCTLINPQTIHLQVGDIIKHYTIDERGYIHTNIREWVGLHATVLLGTVKEMNGKLFTESKVFSCEVISGGYISSLSSEYAGMNVTVIIHGVK